MLLPALFCPLELAIAAAALLPVVVLLLASCSCCSIDSSCADTWCPP